MGNSLGAIISLLLLFIILLLSFMENRLNLKISRTISYFLLFVVALALTYRGFGLDFNNYKDMYIYGIESNDSNIFSQEIEPAYVYLMNISKKIGLSFDLFFIILNLSIFLLLFKSYSRESNVFNVKLLFIFFSLYYFGYMDVTRGFFASSLLLLSTIMYLDKKYFFAFFILVFSFFIHYSALFFIPILFLLNCGISLKKYLTLIVLVIFLGVIFRFSLESVYNSLYFYDHYRFIHNALRYMYSVEEIVFLNNVHFISLTTVYLSVPIVCFFVNILNIVNKIEKSNKYLYAMHVLSCYGIFLFFFFYSIGATVMAVRLCQLLSIGLPFLIYYYCFQLNNKTKVNWRYLYIIFLILILAFISFLYVAKVHQPGAMLYYGNIF